MEREIKFQVQVDSQKDFEKIHEIIKVYIANLELAGTLTVVVEKSTVEEK